MTGVIGRFDLVGRVRFYPLLVGSFVDGFVLVGYMIVMLEAGLISHARD